MNKIIYTIIVFLLTHSATYAISLWPDNLLWWTKDDKITGEMLRRWEINTSHIPHLISWAIDFLMWFAWTIAIIFIIIWAYKIVIWSLSSDKSEWKKTIWMALSWFALAASAYVIIKMVLDNFTKL